MNFNRNVSNEPKNFGLKGFCCIFNIINFSKNNIIINKEAYAWFKQLLFLQAILKAMSL